MPKKHSNGLINRAYMCGRLTIQRMSLKYVS